jgi:acetoacetyl-CoA synthetase
VFVETEVFYAGKTVDLLPKVAEVVYDLATRGLQQAILLPSRITGLDLPISDMSKWYAILFSVFSVLLNDFASSSSLAEFLGTGDNRPLEFEQLPFGQPLYILYSSGTSGKPKCIVHSAGVGVSPRLPAYPPHISLFPGCPHQHKKGY